MLGTRRLRYGSLFNMFIFLNIYKQKRKEVARAEYIRAKAIEKKNSRGMVVLYLHSRARYEYSQKMCELTALRKQVPPM